MIRYYRIKPLLLFFFITLIIVPVRSQGYYGKVLSEGNAILESASVYLLDKDSALIQYTYTDPEGHFRFEEKPNNRSVLYMEINYIGYIPQRIPIQDYYPGITFYLRESSIPIREVKVTANRLYLTGDTLTYSVSGFKTAQDRSIADVLKKMPGIYIREDGVIYYQGEPINKFYIEGLDLLDDRYKLASTNLRAEYVKDIQILERHEPIKSLRGKTFSEQAAINLILKEDAKAKWLAMADLSFGASPLRWNNRLLGMTFNKKSQHLHLYKNDNTGENLMNEFSLADGVSATNITERENNNNIHETLLKPKLLSNPPLEEKRFRLNNEHLLTTNQLYKSGSEGEFKLQISYLNNYKKQENQTSWAYFTGTDTGFSIKESIRQKEYQHQLSSQLLYTQNSEKMYLANKLSINNQFDKNRSEGYSNQFPLLQNYQLPAHQIENEFSTVLPGNKHRLQIKSHISWSYSPQQLTVESTTDDLPFSYLLQHVQTTNFMAHNSMSSIWQYKHIQIDQQVGIRNILQLLNSNTENDPFNIFDRQVRNDMRYMRHEFYYEPTFVYTRKGLGLRLKLNGSIRKFSLKNNLEEKKEPAQTTDMALSPQVILQYEAGWWNFSGKSTFRRTYNFLQSMYPNPIFLNYRTVQFAEGIFQNAAGNTYQASAGYRNPIHGFFFKVGFSYGQNNYKQIKTISYDQQLLTFTGIMPYEHKQPRTVYMINTSKSFSRWDTRLFINLIHTKSKNNQLVEEIFTAYQNHNTIISGKIFIQPLKWFNQQYEFSYNTNKLDITQQSHRTYPRNQLFIHTLNSYFIIGDHWQMGIDQDIYHGDNHQNTTYFLDGVVRFKKRDKEISFIVANLFNKNHFYYSTYQTDKEYQTSYTLMKRYFMLSCSFGI